MQPSDLFVGTSSRSLPTIISSSVTGASLDAAGIVVYSERGATNAVHEITNTGLLTLRLGEFKSNYFGHYVIKSLIENLQGIGARILVKRMARTGSVAASAVIGNRATPTPADCITVKAGQLGRDDVGAWGNKLRVLPIETSRDGSTLAANVLAAASVIEVDSVAPFSVHDWIKIAAERKKIIAIDETLGTLQLDSGLAGPHTAGLAITVWDFALKIYMRDPNTGAVNLVETQTNLSIEPLSEFYFATRINHPEIGSEYISVVDEITSAKTSTSFPATVADDVANVKPLTGGVEGTALSSSAYIAEYEFLRKAKALWLTNAEDFSETVADEGEQYCFNTGPKMIWVGTGAKADLQNYAQMLSWISRRRKTREMPAVFHQAWIEVDDPIGTVTNPRKQIPGIGAQIGHWIYVANLRGVHKVAAGRNQTLVGIRGIVNPITEPLELRNLTNAGFNVTDLEGGVVYNRSGRTPSKAKEFKFMNASLMKIYFKISFEDSLKTVENESNTTRLFNDIERAIFGFADTMFRSSSNGGNESAFASFLKPSGEDSGFNDVVQITVSDPLLNPYQEVMEGVLKANFYFMPPSPAERILIGVGLIFTAN